MAFSFLSSGMSFLNKRLAVRLSIVGAILLIGGAIVAWTQFGPSRSGQKDTQAKKPDRARTGVQPIADLGDKDEDDTGAPVRPASATETVDNGDEENADDAATRSPYRFSGAGSRDALDDESASEDRAPVSPGYGSQYSGKDRTGDDAGGSGLQDDEETRTDDESDSERLLPPPKPGFRGAARHSAQDNHLSDDENESAGSSRRFNALSDTDTGADTESELDGDGAPEDQGEETAEDRAHVERGSDEPEESDPAAGNSAAGNVARIGGGGYRMRDDSSAGTNDGSASDSGVDDQDQEQESHAVENPSVDRGVDAGDRLDRESAATNPARHGVVADSVVRPGPSHSRAVGGASPVRSAPGRGAAMRTGVGTSPRTPARAAPEASLSVSSGSPDGAGSEGYAPTDDELAGGVSAVPGGRQLEGPQTPTLSVAKTASAEVHVGKPANFEIRVRNLGQVAAHNVVVVDHVPEGALLQSTIPKAASVRDGLMTWNLGTMQPGAEHTIQVQIVPQIEGELGSVAQVTFQAQASVRTLATKPDLSVQLSGSKEQVLIGETVQMKITLANKGTGAATGVVVLCDLPEGLTHPAGRELERDIGALRPGETVDIDLLLTAAKPGVAVSTISLQSEGATDQQEQLDIDVIAPGLEIVAAGPNRRYLERHAAFGIQIVNPGTSPAHNVEVVAYLPKGIQFVEADNQGQYYQQQHAVYWRMSELAPKKPVSVRLTGLPVESGKQKLRVDARADLGLVKQTEHLLEVESLAELLFNVSDVNDPIEENTETTYVIEIKNADTQADTNVRVVAELPAGLQYVESSGPTEALEGKSAQHIMFQPLPELGAKASAVYRIKVLGKKAGDHVVKVRVASDRVQKTAVVKEESTHVYRDQ